MEWRKNKVRVKKDKWWEVNACFLHSFLCSFLHTIPVVMWEREVKGRKWRERALHLPLFILPFLPFLTTQHLGIACQVQTHDVGSLVKGLRCNGVVLLFLFSIQLNCNALERKHELSWMKRRKKRTTDLGQSRVVKGEWRVKKEESVHFIYLSSFFTLHSSFTSHRPIKGQPLSLGVNIISGALFCVPFI